jgi:hypothetical protein
MTCPPTNDDQFCPLCGVTLDLHDGPDTCRSAEMKADLLDQFYRPFLGGAAS